MIYFIEHDTAENICHICADPSATIVPLINRVTFNDASGHPLKDANGNPLSPYGVPLNLPVGITEDTYNTVMTGGIDNYTFVPASGTVVKKVNNG